jgi:hypothetical protein
MRACLPGVPYRVLASGAMGTEVWFRNPHTYINELVECAQFNIAWDRGMLVKRKVDPIKHASLHFGNVYPWRSLAIGPQGTAEYREGDEWDKPTAVYPTWTYGEEWALLIDMLENPAGQDIDACTNTKVDGNERPVFGQEHRVVITEAPGANVAPGRQFLAALKVLQEDYPDAIIHYHGAYSYRIAFGLGFGSADVEPRTAAAKGKVTLPSGKDELFERVQAHPQWVTNLGFKPRDLAVPRNRCMYNIKSAVWAGEHYRELFNFRVRNDRSVDTTTPDNSYSPPTTLKALPNKAKPQPGDKIQCNVCSLQNQCKQFRVGAVCSLPDAEPKQLAAYFNTRDADQIIDGMGVLMAAGANRLQEGMRIESILGDLDPQVTKLMGQLFGQGEKLAKLIDPKLRGGVKVNIGVSQGGQAAFQINQGSPNALIAGVVRELESQGIPRDKITAEMIQGVLEGIAAGQDQHKIIEGTAVEEQTA